MFLWLKSHSRRGAALRASIWCVPVLGTIPLIGAEFDETETQVVGAGSAQSKSVAELIAPAVAENSKDAVALGGADTDDAISREFSIALQGAPEVPDAISREFTILVHDALEAPDAISREFSIRVVGPAERADAISREFAMDVRFVGDVNCDDALSVSDISAFVLALTHPAGYESQFPDCDITLADVNRDGVVSVGDIGPFVQVITGM